MKQQVHFFQGYPEPVANLIRNLVEAGHTIVTMTSVSRADNIHTVSTTVITTPPVKSVL